MNSPGDLWNKAKPQGAGEYWPAVTEQEYTINWENPVREIDRTIRTFGRYHTIAYLGTRKILISDADFWQETHSYPIGTLVIETARELLVAARDGFVAVRHWQDI